MSEGWRQFSFQYFFYHLSDVTNFVHKQSWLKIPSEKWSIPREKFISLVINYFARSDFDIRVIILWGSFENINETNTKFVWNVCGDFLHDIYTALLLDQINWQTISIFNMFLLF